MYCHFQVALRTPIFTEWASSDKWYNARPVGSLRFFPLLAKVYYLPFWPPKTWTIPYLLLTSFLIYSTNLCPGLEAFQPDKPKVPFCPQIVADLETTLWDLNKSPRSPFRSSYSTLCLLFHPFKKLTTTITSITIGAIGDNKWCQWRSIGANGDGPNGTNGTSHRHWYQWRSPLVLMAITIGDHRIQ